LVCVWCVVCGALVRNRKDILSFNYPDAIINSDTVGPSVAAKNVYFIHIIGYNMFRQAIRQYSNAELLGSFNTTLGYFEPK